MAESSNSGRQSRKSPIPLPTTPSSIQGGSDISGTLSKLHCHIKQLFFLTILLPQTFSAIFRSINKNKKTHSGKDNSTGSYKSCYSLRTSRRTYCEEVMSNGNIKKSTAYDAEKSLKNLSRWTGQIWEDCIEGWYLDNCKSPSRTAALPKTARGCRTGSKRTLRRCGWRRSGFPACLTATLLTVLYVASLNKGSMQSLATNPVIWPRRWRRWWGSLPGTPWWRPAWASGPGSRLSAQLTVVLLNMLIVNVYLC